MMITLELRVYATGVSLAACQVALGLLAAALPAQQACRAEDYFDDGYRSIVSVDFAQIRGSGVWDEMDIGAAKLLLHLVEQQLETSFEDLDRFRMVSFAGLPKAVGEEPGSNLMIVERNVPFGPPDGVVGGRLRREQVGAHELLYQEGFGYGQCQPAPNVRLIGRLAHLRKKLAGPKQPGLPCPDIMSLLSERKSGLLGYVVVDLGAVELGEDLLPEVPAGTWPADDRPQFGMVRLAAVGEVDDPHLVLEVVVRHLKSGAGVMVTDRLVRRELEAVIKAPQWRRFAKMLKHREQIINAGDLSVTVKIGRARNAIGVLDVVMLGALQALRVVDQLLPKPAEPPKEQAAGGGHEHK